jgi:pimeloyl-ACP methyl ester carboxylesterase
MVSLWGSKNGEERSEGDEAETSGDDSRQQPRQSGGREPDERTRLLPPRHDGFLDPDDPAVSSLPSSHAYTRLSVFQQVSPYNLWSVRALRYLCVLFLVISFLWWVLLLVSIFVSPPMMHSRGSGFFDFSYTTLTVGNLLVAILFFSTPSKPMEIGSLIVAGFLLIDMIIILAVPRIRAEEGWVGIASVVWATVMALYNVLTDRVVAWGKKEEEERLTGRQESRRTLREWCAVLTATVLMVVMIAVVVLLTATLILRGRDAGLAPPGERYYVDGDKYQIHLACVGEVSYNSEGKRNPTVLLEGGETPVEDTFDDWIYDAYTNGTIYRYCYYDRPGLGWSDNAPSPHSAGMTSDALSEALARAGEEHPWVLVSAGIGSIYSRIFSSRHRHDVSGIMLIDPLHEDLLYKVGKPGRGFVLWARGIISPLGYDRLFGAIAKGRTPQDRVYGRSAYQNGKYIKAKLQENLVANSLTKNEVSQARNIQDENTPLVVVSSGIDVRKDGEWEQKQKDLTTITNDLVSWDVVNAAPHEVWTTLEGRQILEKRLGELVKG